MRYSLFFVLVWLVSYVPVCSQPKTQLYQSDPFLVEEDDEIDVPIQVDPLMQPSMSLRYSVLLVPTVSVLLDKEHTKRIADQAPYTFSYVKDYPLSRCFTAGFTGQVGVLSNTIHKKEYTGLLFEVCALLKPRFPIDMTMDRAVIFYSNVEIGLASLMASSIQHYRGAKVQHVPTSGVAAGCTLGAEYLFNTWMSVYLEGGIRYNIINHLLVVPALTNSNKEVVEKAKKEDKKFFYHDIVSIPISIGFKLFV
jgi:hypothetical protein